MSNKKRKITKSGFFRLFVEYGIHLWVILFLVNIALLYVVHFYLIAATCMTSQQVNADSRCLYIYGTQIFQKGSRSSPHVGHPCGSDVTTILPPSHFGNQASYLIPNFVANLCSNTAPTPTPTPTMNIVPSAVCLGGVCTTATPTPTSSLSIAPVPSAVIPSSVVPSTSIPVISIGISGIPTGTPGSSGNIWDQILKLLQDLINWLTSHFSGGSSKKTTDNDSNKKTSEQKSAPKGDSGKK